MGMPPSYTARRAEAGSGWRTWRLISYYAQIESAQAALLQASGINLESYWSNWPQQYRLAADQPGFSKLFMIDPIAPVDNTLLMFAALRRAQVPVALHLFQHAGHGWGKGHAGSEPAAWPLLLQAWLKAGSY